MSRQSHEHPNWQHFFPAKPRKVRTTLNIGVFIVTVLILAAWVVLT